MKAVSYPYVKELITDANGNGEVLKVVLDVEDYRRVLEAVEDAALHKLMNEAAGETPLSREDALAALEEA